MDREYLERWDRMADQWARRSDEWDRRAEQWNRQEERRDALMAKISHEIELTREEVRLSREQRERSDAMHADLRVFIREMTARVERSGRDTSRALADVVAALADLRAESRAHTSAILTLLDRLGGPEAGTA